MALLTLAATADFVGRAFVAALAAVRRGAEQPGGAEAGAVGEAVLGVPAAAVSQRAALSVAAEAVVGATVEPPVIAWAAASLAAAAGLVGAELSDRHTAPAWLAVGQRVAQELLVAALDRLHGAAGAARWAEVRCVRNDGALSVGAAVFTLVTADAAADYPPAGAARLMIGVVLHHRAGFIGWAALLVAELSGRPAVVDAQHMAAGLVYCADRIARRLTGPIVGALFVRLATPATAEPILPTTPDPVERVAVREALLGGGVAATVVAAALPLGRAATALITTLLVRITARVLTGEGGWRADALVPDPGSGRRAQNDTGPVLTGLPLGQAVVAADAAVDVRALQAGAVPVTAVGQVSEAVRLNFAPGRRRALVIRVANRVRGTTLAFRTAQLPAVRVTLAQLADLVLSAHAGGAPGHALTVHANLAWFAGPRALAGHLRGGERRVKSDQRDSD